MTDFEQQEDWEDEDFVSKTQIKKELKAINDFGRELSELNPKKLAKLPLGEITLKAILQVQGIKSHIGKKRQFGFIAKLLREEDIDAIKLALEERPNLPGQEKVDPLREEASQFLNGENTLGEQWLDTHPGLERQKLRQLQRNFSKQAKPAAKEKIINQLYQYLKEFRG